MMRLPQICYLIKIPWGFMVFISMFCISCAELDGVFPKFEAQKKVETAEKLPTSSSVNQKQEILSQENLILQKKIETLQSQILDLQRKQKEQREDVLLLKEQWEMNFVLLERSVEESLNSSNDYGDDVQIYSNIQKEQSNQKINGIKKPKKKNSFLPVENFSLLDNDQNKVKKKSLENNESTELNNIDFEKEEIEVIEEPGFTDIGKVNLTDLEESANLIEGSEEILLSGMVSSESSQFPVSEKDSNMSIFFDPDLKPPDNPVILIRHPGVKKIYNQGMTALIQKDHLMAIRVFENFIKRFPNNVDSDNAYYWIGRSYFELNELEKAESAFRKVLNLFDHRPTSQGFKTPDSIYMLGKLQFRKNLDQRAYYYLEEVIKRYPGSAAARNAKRELKR